MFTFRKAAKKGTDGSEWTALAGQDPSECTSCVFASPGFCLSFLESLSFFFFFFFPHILRKRSLFLPFSLDSSVTVIKHRRGGGGGGGFRGLKTHFIVITLHLLGN